MRLEIESAAPLIDLGRWQSDVEVEIRFLVNQLTSTAINPGTRREQRRYPEREENEAYEQPAPSTANRPHGKQPGEMVVVRQRNHSQRSQFNGSQVAGLSLHASCLVDLRW